jgi:hypothetical protein
MRDPRPWAIFVGFFALVVLLVCISVMAYAAWWLWEFIFSPAG